MKTPEGERNRASALTEQVQLLTRTMQILRNNVAAAGNEGLPWSTYMLLFHLIAGGPRRASALAEAACIDPSTVSRQIDSLVRLGLVERQADPADGRATVLVATPAGLEMQERMRRSRDRMMAGLVEDWDDEDIATLTRLLERFNTTLTDRLPGIVTALQQRAPADSGPVRDTTDETTRNA